MGEFIFEANEKFEKIEENIIKVEKSQKELCQFYGEHESKFQLPLFLADIGTFIKKVDEVLFEMQKKKEQEEKKKVEREKKKKCWKKKNVDEKKKNKKKMLN